MHRIGAGSAFAFISVLVVAADIFPKKRFALLAGITQMLGALGAMGGELPFSQLVNLIGWRHTMRVVSLFGFVLVLFIWLFVRYEKINVYHCQNQRQNMWLSLKHIFRQK